MLFAALFLVVVGIIMLARPAWVWRITEQWKSYGAEEPSDLYRISVRIGGVLVTLGGIAAMVAFSVSGG